MAILVVIWVGIGYALYREANRFAQQHGQCPWGLPPVFWGIVGLMAGLIGALFMLIAEKTTTKQAPNNVVWSQGPYADPRFAPPPQQQWTPPVAPGAPAPTTPGAPPEPNVGGSEFLPKR